MENQYKLLKLNYWKLFQNSMQSIALLEIIEKNIIKQINIENVTIRNFNMCQDLRKFSERFKFYFHETYLNTFIKLIKWYVSTSLSHRTH